MSGTPARTYVRKLTYLQREEAFKRAVGGEPAHAIARDMGVTEGALRWHWRKNGCHPREVWRLAWQLYQIRMEIELMPRRQRRAVAREVKRLTGDVPDWLASAAT